MSNHFDGKYEAEIKYRLADHSAFLSQLSTMHAEPFVVNNEETDWFSIRSKRIWQTVMSVCQSEQ